MSSRAGSYTGPLPGTFQERSGRLYPYSGLPDGSLSSCGATVSPQRFISFSPSLRTVNLGRSCRDARQAEIPAESSG
jgi:hypothetical protein